MTVCVLALLFSVAAGSAMAQVGNSGSIEGVVTDPSGGGVGNAQVEISYAVSGFHRETVTAPDGTFKFTNVPFNTYHAVVTAAGFTPFTQDVDVRSAVPTRLEINLKISTEVTTVTVTEKGSDLIETESTFHTDVDQGIIDRLPLESASSSVTNLVTLVSAGVAADSNGNLHGLGSNSLIFKVARHFGEAHLCSLYTPAYARRLQIPPVPQPSPGSVSREPAPRGLRALQRRPS